VWCSEVLRAPLEKPDGAKLQQSILTASLEISGFGFNKRESKKDKAEVLSLPLKGYTKALFEAGLT